MLERDPELLEFLENRKAQPFEGAVYRVVWVERSPVQGSSAARGRWNSPDGQFEVLNTSCVAEGAAAEFEAFWSLFEQRPDRKALNWKLRVRLKRVSEFDFEVLEQLGVRRVEYGNRTYSRTQAISDSLNYLGFDGAIVPSARYDGKNLIVYMQNLDRYCVVREEVSHDFQWRT